MAYLLKSVQTGKSARTTIALAPAGFFEKYVKFVSMPPINC
jgi:hypothetical protein